jgi:hypothetical protein
MPKASTPIKRASQRRLVERRAARERPDLPDAAHDECHQQRDEGHEDPREGQAEHRRALARHEAHVVPTAGERPRRQAADQQRAGDAHAAPRARPHALIDQIEGHMLARRHHESAGPEDHPDVEHHGQLIAPRQRAVEAEARRDLHQEDDEQGCEQPRADDVGAAFQPALHKDLGPAPGRSQADRAPLGGREQSELGVVISCC